MGNDAPAMTLGPSGRLAGRRRSALGDQLREAVEASRLDPAELARRAGVHCESIRRWRAGAQGLYLATAGAIAAVLDLHLDKVAAPGPRAPGPEFSAGGIDLRGPERPPIVRGVAKPVLDAIDYEIVLSLLAAGPEGLSMGELIHINSDVRGRMKRLAESDPEGWGKVYQSAGIKGKRYRMGIYD